LLALASKINLLTHYAKGTLFDLSLIIQLLIDLLIQIFSLGLLSFFSTFPHGTFSLSLNLLYLALEDGSPFFKQVFSHFT